MTGGLIQLVSYGVEDLFLTRDPQITLFKVVYRRHTNFSTEPIPQNFIQPIDFGKKATCIISKQGDLINKVYLVITLPSVIQGRDDDITMFAWIRKIGFALIKNFEIVIGGELIDRQYGEWLNAWYELMGPKDIGFDKMIGNVRELTDFSHRKDEYVLYVPLQFWFCRATGSALPLVSLQYSEVKINVELNDIDRCSLITPTHYISVLNDFVNFKQFEYIEQNVDGQIASGIFTHYDFTNKRLYYMKISHRDFQAIKRDSEVNVASTISEAFNIRNMKYSIKGAESGNMVMPAFNALSQTYPTPSVLDVSLGRCFLLVDYIFLDEEERMRFLQTKHDYLIEQVAVLNEQTIESSNAIVDIGIVQPCKFIVWMVRSNYINSFDYTDSYKYSTQGGKSLVLDETIIINSRERISFRPYAYFNYLQPYQCFPYAPPEGINVYSFSLFPDQFQPSGSCNMSMIDNIQIKLRLSSNVSINNAATFRGYALIYNVLRVANGLSGKVFV
jgi:hypothetical protein